MTTTHSPFSLAFEDAERELGSRIGYPALVYGEQTKTLPPLTEAESATLARLNAQDATIAALRLALDEAHQHVGALTKGGLVAHAAAWMLRQLVRNERIKGEHTLDEARIMAMHYEDTGFNIAVADALAWLRREA